MKKFFVIGNPIDHSLSPKLHNYWIKENNIEFSTLENHNYLAEGKSITKIGILFQKIEKKDD